MKIFTVVLLSVFCASFFVSEIKARGAFEDSPLFGIVEAVGKLAGPGIGEVVEEMTQTFKTFSQIAAFFRDEENIRHVTFVLSSFEKSIQEGCSVWKNQQETINREGLSDYLEDIKKRMNDKLRENVELPQDMISFFNQNVSPLFDLGVKMLSDFDPETLPLKPSYSQLTQVIGLASTFKLVEMFNPEVFKQALDTVGNPLNLITKEIEKHLTSDQIRLLTGVITMIANNQKAAKPKERETREKEEL